MFADIARIFMNLAGIGSQFISPNASGDWVSLGAPDFSGTSSEYKTASGLSMGASGLGIFMPSINNAVNPRALANATPIRFDGVEPNPKEVKAVEKGSYSLILWTLFVAEIMELTTGFGPPDEGAEFKVGSEQYTKIVEYLATAIPDTQWQGTASTAYGNVDTKLQDIAKSMAELDAQLEAIVKDQSEWVTHIRLGFGILKPVLIAAFVVEQVVRLAPPPGGPIPAQVFATAVSVIGGLLIAGMIGTLITFSVLNGNKAKDLIPKYDDLAEKAKPSGTPLTQRKAPAAEESRVSSFESIPGSMSGARSSSTLPGAAKSPTTAGDSEDEKAPPSASTAPGETSGNGSAGAPQTPGDKTPSMSAASAATVPTLAQLVQMSGQSGKVDQLTGRLRQLAQTSQQGQGAAPAERAAADEAAPVGEVVGAGAVSGAEAAERAPVDGVALGAEQAPSPVQRPV